MTSPAEHTLSIGDASACWQRLAECVDALSNAWQQEVAPPALADFLPAESGPLRRMVLVELVKVDMEQRIERGVTFKPVESYAADFPELLVGGDLPCDLIYEEFHLRRNQLSPPTPAAYYKRFPKQASDLARLLGGGQAPATSSLVRASRPLKMPEPGERLDDFDLLTRLGKGAFATVFLARQRSLERLVALKVSKDSGTEPQTLAQLDHPNIVRVFDQRTLPDGGMRLLYMQFVAGGTLQEAIAQQVGQPPMLRSGATFLAAIDNSLARRGESAPSESYLRRRLQGASWAEVVCWLGARLAAALAYAHEKGVLHRDVKPANVLLAADGAPKLADFNISFSSKLDGAMPAAYFGGSLAYMSPEQLEACDPSNPREPGELDGRADIYSLAIVLWEMLAGQRPFDDNAVSGNWAETLANMTAARKLGPTPDAFARLPTNCPGGLRETLLQCLSGDRDERHASAAELARALELCLMPRAQRLLAAPSKRLLAMPRHFPVTSLILGGLIPNVAMSVLNIWYNFQEIVRDLPPYHQWVFWLQVVLVNLIAYTWGTATTLYLCWPVIVGMRESKKAGDRWRPTQRRLGLLRARALQLGDYAALICAVDWAFSGFVIPVWIRAQAGSSALTSQKFVHFVVSQTICGLIAATLSFFMVTLASLRTCYPRLFCAKAPSVGSGAPLAGAGGSTLGAALAIGVGSALGAGRRDAAGSASAAPSNEARLSEIPSSAVPSTAARASPAQSSAAKLALVRPSEAAVYRPPTDSAPADILPVHGAPSAGPSLAREQEAPTTDVVLASEPLGIHRGEAEPHPPEWDGVALRFPSGGPSMPPVGAPSAAAEPMAPAELASAGELAESDAPAPQDAERLTALAGRVWFYFGLAVAAPFLAVMVVVRLDVDKTAIGSFGLVGLAAFGLSFWLSQIIRSDLAALAMTFQPTSGAISSSSDLSDSFWTGSRR